MSTGSLRAVIGRAAFDLEFRERLFNFPEQALASYSLSAEERLTLQRIPLEGLYASVGYLAVNQLLPLRFGRRLVVAPDWLDPPLSAGDLLIRLDQRKTRAMIDPDGQPITDEGDPASLDAPVAYGSGMHPTTRLCLGALEDYLSTGEIVLDLGTGSGILAIAAARLGASQVLALDTNEAAVQIARQHVALNQVESIVRVEQGSLENLQAVSPGEARFRAQLVVANLFAVVLHVLLKQGLAMVLDPDGRMILSGLSTSDLDGMRDAIQAAGLRLIDQRQLSGWHALICQNWGEGD